MTAVPVRLLSNSEASDFKQCRRKWWLRWVLGLSRDREDYVGARSEGSRIHEGLAAYYSHPGPEGEARTAAMEVIEAGFRRDEAEILGAEKGPDAKLLKDLGRMQELVDTVMEGYFQWVEEEGEDDFLEFLAAEHQQTAPLGTVAGREWHLIELLDAKVRDNRDGYVAHLDHKSTTAFGRLEPTLHMAPQFKHYAIVDRLAEEDGGARADGTLVNMLRRVKRGPSSKPPFYKRKRVDHSDAALRSYFHRLVGQAGDMAAAEDRLAAGEDHRVVAYPSPGPECAWSCDFFAECPLLDEDIPFNLATAGLVARDPLANRYDLTALPGGEDPGAGSGS